VTCFIEPVLFKIIKEIVSRIFTKLQSNQKYLSCICKKHAKDGNFFANSNIIYKLQDVRTIFLAAEVSRLCGNYLTLMEFSF